MTTVWQTRKLKEITTKIGSGSTPRGGEAVYKTSGVPLIRSMNVHFAGFKTDGITYLDDSEAAKLDHVIVQGEDVLLNITGASIGRVTTAPASMIGSRVNQHVCIIRPKTDLSPRYLAHYLASPSQQVMNVQVGVTRQALTKAMVENWEIPFPPLDEQQQIVAEIEKQFTRLDAGVAGLRCVQANLKRYRAAVLKAACEGKLVPTEAELAKQAGRTFESGAKLLASISDFAPSEAKPRRAGRLWGAGHVPDLTDEERLTMSRGWVWTKVRDLGFDPESAVQVGPMSMKSEDFTDDGVPVLNVGCVQWDRFEESKLDHLPPIKASEFERYRIKPATFCSHGQALSDAARWPSPIKTGG